MDSTTVSNFLNATCFTQFAIDWVTAKVRTNSKKQKKNICPSSLFFLDPRPVRPRPFRAVPALPLDLLPFPARRRRRLPRPLRVQGGRLRDQGRGADDLRQNVRSASTERKDGFGGKKDGNL